MKEIRNVNKLIPLEVDLSESIIIDDSWGELNAFKKCKKIIFYAKCSYFVDLSKIETCNLVENSTSYNLSLVVPPPDIYSIDINENKTIFEKTNNGFFRFGEIDISAEEYNLLIKELDSNIKDKMNNKDLIDQARKNTKNSLEEILNSSFQKKFNIDLKFANE